MVFSPPAGIFKCMFQFHCITKWIRGADYELFKRPCYLLIILCSSFPSMTTAVKDSYRLKGYRAWIGAIWLSHYRSCRTCFTISAAVDNYKPKNVSHTLEQACWHKRHTFKLWRCVVIGAFLSARMWNECMWGKRGEWNGKQSVERQTEAEVSWLSYVHFLRLWVKKQRRTWKIPTPLTLEGRVVAAAARFSQIKVWSNCYKGRVSPPRLLGEVKLSVNRISRGLNKALLKFRAIMVIERTTNLKRFQGYSSFKRRRRGNTEEEEEEGGVEGNRTKT